MTGIFITILNMSLTASCVAAVVILARLLLKKTPKIFSYALWAVVLFRMVCPFSFESIVSLLPAKSETIPQDIIYSPAPEINSGINFVDDAVNRTINTVMPPVQREEAEEEIYTEPKTVVSPIKIIMTAGTYIWLFGIVALLGYAVISYIKTKRRVFDATLVRDNILCGGKLCGGKKLCGGNIFETDRIKTPFVLGFIKPKIYIPAGITEDEADYVVKHEQTHIRRGDHFAKVFAFAALALHWFNPLMWISYFLMAKDMELSCDESVMKRSPEDIRANYSNSLLSLSVRQSGLPTPLAFGESNVKARVKNVLRYKRPAFWISIISVIAVLAVTVALAGNRQSAEAAIVSEPEKTEESKSVIQPETVSVSSLSQSGEYIAAKNDNITVKINPASESKWKGITNGNEISCTINSQVPTADGIEIYFPNGTVIKTHDTVKINGGTIIIAGDTKIDKSGKVIAEGSGQYTIIDKTGFTTAKNGGNQSTYAGFDPDGDANKSYNESGIKSIIDLLPYMSQDAIDEIVRKEYERTGRLDKINSSLTISASDNVFDELARKEYEKNGFKYLSDIAWTLSQKTLNELAAKEVEKNGLSKGISDILIFMSESVIDDLARKEYEKNGFKNLNDVSWLISQSVLNELAVKEVEKNGLSKGISDIFMFMDQNAMDEIARKDYEKNGFKNIKDIVWTLSQSVIDELVKKEYEKNGFKNIPNEILIWMGQSAVNELALKEVEKNGVKGIPNEVVIWMSQSAVDEIARIEYDRNGLKNIQTDIWIWMSQSATDELARKEYEKSGLNGISGMAWVMSNKLLKEISQKEYERTGQDPKINTNIGRFTNTTDNGFTTVETPFIGDKKYLSIDTSKTNEITAKLGKDGAFAEIYAKNSGKSDSEASVTVKDGNKSAVVKKDKDGTVSVTFEKSGKIETTVINPEIKQDMTVVLNGKTVEINQSAKGGTAYITVKEGDITAKIKIVKNAQISLTKYFDSEMQICPTYSS